jgi:hypothetical protein
LTLVESLLFYSETLSFYNVAFLRGNLFKRLPEIWRLVTPFLLTGSNLEFLFDLYFSTVPRYLGVVSDPRC